MKIGIVTYHRSHNYGALLQAIGLRQYLLGKGHKVYFIDYWPQYQERMYQPIRSYNSCKEDLGTYIRGVVKDILLYPLKSKRIKKFKEFINSYITPYCIPMTEKCDVIIFGSDQIWRKQTALGGQFDPIYFGQGSFNCTRYISYAASMGEVKILSEDEENIRHFISSFNSVSVREVALEKALQRFIKEKKVDVVADPTILLGNKNWIALLKDTQPQIKGTYILYYRLMGNSFNDNTVKKFAEDKNLKLIVLNGIVRQNDYFNGSIDDANPLEMLNLIKNASYIFTSSYHGLVFSLLFEKQVYCAFSNNSIRAESLLNYLGLNERLVKKNDNLYMDDINYERVRPLLIRLGKESSKWLDNAIG